MNLGLLLNSARLLLAAIEPSLQRQPRSAPQANLTVDVDRMTGRQRDVLDRSSPGVSIWDSSMRQPRDAAESTKKRSCGKVWLTSSRRPVVAGISLASVNKVWQWQWQWQWMEADV